MAAESSANALFNGACLDTCEFREIPLSEQKVKSGLDLTLFVA